MRLMRRGLASWLCLGVALITLVPASAATEQHAYGDTDWEFLQIGRAVPSFGGAFVEGDTLNIWLTSADEGAKERVRSALVRMDDWFDVAETRVLAADYTWAELHRWSAESTTEIFSIEGVVYSDTDETTNRLEFGVNDPRVQGGEVDATLARLGVPAGAYRVVASEAPHLLLPPSRPQGILMAAVTVAVVVVIFLAGALYIRRRKRNAQPGARPSPHQ